MESFELIFLGTGAADAAYYPKENQRFSLDKQIKRNSSVLINKSILIDVAPESFFFANEVLKLDLSQVSDILLTHSHTDHFDLHSLEGFVRNSKNKINFYCHESAIPFIQSFEIIQYLNLYPLKSFESIEILDVQIKSLEANHEIVETQEVPLHYVLWNENKKIFYGCDGGWFLARTWTELMGMNLDLVVMDATVGNNISDFRIASHNTFPMLQMLIPAMKKNYVIKENAKVVLSHFALSLYDGSEDYGDMICAFDGMKINI